jgi:hypothetical protein
MAAELQPEDHTRRTQIKLWKTRSICEKPLQNQSPRPISNIQRPHSRFLFSIRRLPAS